MSGSACGVILPAPLLRLFAREHVPLNGISIYLRRIHARAPLLSYNAHVARDPASVMKLVTALVSLYDLGPAYTWTTGAYTRGPVVHGVLRGNLYLRGDGDPYLITKSFWDLLHGLRRLGIHRIAGNVVLDEHYLDAPRAPRGAFDGLRDRTYNVRPQALLVNFQAVEFRFIPGHSNVRVLPDPYPTTLRVVDRLRLVGGSCGDWRADVHLQILHHKSDNVALFAGRYPRACGPQHLYRVTDNNRRYVSGVFTELWREQGGVFNGRFLRGRLPRGARLLYAVHSRPLADILRSVDKYSNNVMGRLLVMTLGAVKEGVPGTTAKGLAVMRAWLARHHLHLPHLVLRNGVGLSRSERITAAEVGRVLRYAYNGRYMPEYVSSLPIAGIDGTLRYRFLGSPVAGHLHGKTGTINGVDTLAGYLQRGRRRYIVVVLEDYPEADTESGFQAEDGVIKWLYARK
ncbi:D-alanyl-D-alanine carboxypeptidase/D-alanyl-D-alanine-endopeptidase [Acidiferrobacter sp.]|uniref:D-alanyl-D-alanine carboxypeptidase/D-alanyl-D-alanine endopeptidase n=1 Tax=Acidiferrobacter sp. TaxID=1872107 RepID=UPI00262014B3|nr:D-alanyl-D-alanine carboxypeptidase/D-alanyl-D-alanine-endopeptidase [Acidiferrobacter sp.]